MLRLPAITRLNLKFSTWIMSMVDGPNRCIKLSHDRYIKFWPEDIHKVFGIPCGTIGIHSPEYQQTESSVQFFRSVLGLSDKGNQVLKNVEAVLMKELNESTASNLEIDCFKMAFVIYSMSHILSPSTKHDVSVIDYWSAIANTDKIVDFNFCEYVFADLLAACWKVKQDIQENRPLTHLTGCHLFFQIFYLDNLDLGMLNLPHNSYPRISCFDESRIRKMILQCTRIGPGPTDFSIAQIRHHNQICYMRAIWDRKPVPNASSSKKPTNPAKEATIKHSPQQHSGGTSSYVSHIPTPAAFTTILKDNYPNLAHSELGILLNQHNVVSFKACNSLKMAVHEENTRFLHNILSILSKSCICCSLHGSTCIAQELQPSEAPLLSNLCRQSNQQARSEGATSSAPKGNLKGVSSAHTMNELTPSLKKSRLNFDADDEVTPKQYKSPAQLDQSKCWADSLIGGIIMFNDEADPPEDAVLFAQISPFKPTPSSSVHTSYADSHWTDGKSHIDPPPLQCSSTSILIYGTPQQPTLPDPGSHIPIPIDNQSLYPGCTPKWHIFIEVDFSTSVLAGDNVWDMVSIQKQFTAPNVIFQIPNTRLFIIPAYLPSGWAVYCWDMKRKIIHMCDPMADTVSYTAQKESHVIIADKLHDALFTCLRKFFKSWHVEATNWKKNFQFLSATLFARNESGVCMLHTARHFNGIGLTSKLANETLAHQKKLIAAELLQLDGNLATIPAPLKAIFDGHHQQ